MPVLSLVSPAILPTTKSKGKSSNCSNCNCKSKSSNCKSNCSNCNCKTIRQIKKKKPNFEALKHRVISLSNAGQVEDAVSVVDGMTPDLTTFSVLLKSCIRSRNFHLGRALHSRLIHSGIKLDAVVLNSLISLYSKCGDWVTAKTIFDSMGGLRDVVSWSAIISCLAHNGMESQALLTFVDMLDQGQAPNHFCFSAAIHACSDGDGDGDHAPTGLAIFGFLIKTGYFDSDVCVGCALIDLFAKAFHDLHSARKVFDKMPHRNSVTWTLLMTRYSQLGRHQDGIRLFPTMLSSASACIPDRFTLTSLVSACAQSRSLSVGQQMHSWVIKSGLCTDVYIGCSLVDMYAKCATTLDDATKLFQRMPNHNVMSWTALITGYVQSGGLHTAAIHLYCQMITQGHVFPNHFTYSTLLKACGALEIGKQVHNHVLKSGLASVNCVANALISMYARAGSMEDAQKAFEMLLDKNLISYNAIIDAYAKNTTSDEAFNMFNKSEETQTGLDSFTFASLLSSAASLGAVGKGEQMHARLVKSGFHSDQRVCNALISMYSRCGDIQAAARVFNKMEQRNVISWTSIITGFAKHGLARSALKVFDQMLEAGVKPNEVTYIAVLSACSHAGMVDEGLKHFSTMYSEHNITPKMEHYACVVDLLGRSGSLEKSVDFIYSMPFKADALVWRTLLGACQVHGNTNLGKLSAKMITELDPNDPSAYVLLSNLYASKGQWEKVVKIRKTMKERNLIKEAGCSWIEAENQAHKFYVGDTCHPRADEIYKELDQLVMDIKKLGYVPDTDFVLHELDEKEKERYLVQHSEKIAVAFGLISVSKTKPIRVFKNLRVCGDCHTAMKYISVARGREIVVRDSNRFHHFKNGSCSCNDYW